MAEKRGTIGGMPSRVKLSPPSKSAKTLGLGVSQAALFASAYSRELRRTPGISAHEAMENATRNIQRLMLKPPY